MFIDSSGETLISLRLNSSRNKFRNTWIRNSGAIDHMTYNPNHLKTNSLCQSNRKIVVVMELPPQWLVKEMLKLT